MPNDDGIHQPQTVSDQISGYLKMSSSKRHRFPRQKADEPQKPSRQRPLIDNDGLELDEGNDLA